MADFFNRRSDSYDEHMRRSVASFETFYEAVAQSIPRTEEPLRILDIGCGTGLELGPIFERVPHAQVTGIDLSEQMLAQLREKHADRLPQMTLIHGSYLETPLGESEYDYALSVMTLHHLLPDRKRQLYGRIYQALKDGGKYVEGDYVVSVEEAAQLLSAYRERVEGDEEGAYHIDIPLTMEKQRALLLGVGFVEVEVVWEEGEAVVIVAAA